MSGAVETPGKKPDPKPQPDKEDSVPAGPQSGGAATAEPKSKPAESPAPGPAAEPGKFREDCASKFVEETAAAQSAYEALFSKGNLLRGVSGDKCEFPDFSEVEARFPRAHCLVITGFDESRCRWAATYLATKVGFEEVFASTSSDVAATNHAGIIQRLQGRPVRTCVILNCISGYDARQFPLHLEDFRRDTETLSRTSHGLILYLHPDAIRNVAGSFPQHVPLLETPEFAPSTSNVDAATVDHLFAPQLETLTDIVAADNRLLIPRVLTRLAVLFPGISAAHFELLLRKVLEGQAIEIAPASEKIAADRRDAFSLWNSSGSGRGLFEKQAGLTRSRVGTAHAIRFASTVLSESANAWVWQYPADLFDLLIRTSGLGILFSNRHEPHQNELFERYVSAMLELAHQAPDFFAARWLECVLLNYCAWTEGAVAASENPEETLAGLLKNSATYAQSGRFAKRLGLVAGKLLQDGSGVLVESFLAGLMRRRLGELVLRITRHMGDALAPEQRLRWIERNLHEGDQSARQAAVRELALQVYWSPETSAPYLEAVQRWFNDGEAEGAALRREAALAFPVYLFDLADNGRFDPEGAESPLLARLELPMGSAGTFRAYCERAVSDPRFRIATGVHFVSPECAENRPSLGFALAFHWCAAALPDARQSVAFDLLTHAFEPLRLAEQNEIRRWWRQIAEYCWEIRTRADSSPEGICRRRHFERRHDIAKALQRF